jgi:hypothetical protein
VVVSSTKNHAVTHVPNNHGLLGLAEGLQNENEVTPISFL